MPEGLLGLLAALIAAAYLWATSLIYLATRSDQVPSVGIRWLTGAGWLAHGAVCAMGLLANSDQPGLSLSLGIADALSVCAWVTVGLLLAGSLRGNTPRLLSLGLLLLPIAALALLLGAWLPDGAAARIDTGWEIELHVALSLLAYGFLTLGALLAIALRIQDRGLRMHTPHGLAASLPPLETTERLMFQWILIGFALLTLSLLSGLFFVENWLSQHLAHKIILSLIAWALFGALLLGRQLRGWRGRRSVNLALSGYGVLVLAYFGVKFVLEALQQTPWDAA